MYQTKAYFINFQKATHVGIIKKFFPRKIITQTNPLAMFLFIFICGVDSVIFYEYTGILVNPMLDIDINCMKYRFFFFKHYMGVCCGLF